MPKGARGYSSSNSLPAGIEALEQLKIRNMEDHTLVNEKIIRIVKDVDVLRLAYGNIKYMSKPETLDGIDALWFERISKELGTGQFKFSPVRRVEITKGVTRPRQKVVQEAMRLVLDAIFSPTFSPNSHGFVKGIFLGKNLKKKNCHTALNQIHLTFTAVN